MLDRYSQLVIRFRWPIVILWLGIGLGLPYFAPSWNSVTHDGDFAYLPPEAPTVLGQELLDSAFEVKPPKSQIVVAVVRSDLPLQKEDFATGYDAARRLINLFAARVWADLASGHLDSEESASPELSRPRRALDLLDQAIAMSRELEELLPLATPDRPASTEFTHSLAISYYLRSAFADRLAKTPEGKKEAGEDLQQALLLDPQLSQRGIDGVIRSLEIGHFPINDMWTWRSKVVGERLIDDGRYCRLMVMHFPTEFMATGNIATLERVEKELELARGISAWLPPRPPEKAVELLISGSAAVGADMLRSSARSIRNTDWLTAALVLIILAVVYRSPMMVAIPMAVIYLSLQISLSLLAMLAQAAAEPNWEFWDFKVFTTTRIFVVVLLYGAGTDACLFLISRFREECGKGSDTLIAVRKSLGGVGGALLASAITTILGLAMLYFAKFGKYHYTGPAIAFCLGTATLACLSLGPALLAVLGPWVFWPWPPLQQRRVELAVAARRKRATFFGKEISEWVVRRPALIIILFLLILIGPALQGWVAVEKVTYDVLLSLGRDLPSRRGTSTLVSLFEQGEAGPIVLLISKPGFDAEKKENREAIIALHKALFMSSQVASVRSLLDPLGTVKPEEFNSLASAKAWQARIAQANQVTRAVFVGRRFGYTVLKWEVVPRQSPFSREGYLTLERVEKVARDFLDDPKSPLHGARVDIGGVTAALRDLENVTKADYRLMRWLVTLSVLGALIVALRRPVVCLYIVGTVLLGFFVTMGITYWTFAIANLDTGYLLDWRVPMFLFVILVAVGSDYSVYLATRVFEEQATYGPFTGLRRAVVQTGGVISSCGIIMAGTFISMTSGVWASGFPSNWSWPRQLFGSPQDVQRGIVELGFALAIGILLDTFVVRTILLPAFLASLAHWKAHRDLKRQKRQVV